MLELWRRWPIQSGYNKLTQTLQDKIDKLSLVMTYLDNRKDVLLVISREEVNKAIQELREEINKLFKFQHTEYYEGSLVCTDIYILLKDVLALIGESKK